MNAELYSSKVKTIKLSESYRREKVRYMTFDEFQEQKESTVRSLLLMLADKGFTVDQTKAVLGTAINLAGYMPMKKEIIDELDKDDPMYC